MKVYDEDVMNISQEITYALQDAKIIEGKPDNYNFIVDDVIREVLRKMLNLIPTRKRGAIIWDK